MDGAPARSRQALSASNVRATAGCGGWMSFVSVLETIGKGFAKGLKWAVEYAVPVERLVGLLFPAVAPVANELADATSLIQTAVLLVEQKYAASGAQSGTGTQKLA